MPSSGRACCAAGTAVDFQFPSTTLENQHSAAIFFLPYAIAKSHCWQCFPKQHPRRLCREESGASTSQCRSACKVARIVKFKRKQNSPKSSNLCVALYICLSFWSCFSIFLLASLCAFSSFLWSSVLLLPKQPIFPQERRKRGSRVGGDGGICGVGGGV